MLIADWDDEPVKPVGLQLGTQGGKAVFIAGHGLGFRCSNGCVGRDIGEWVGRGKMEEAFHVMPAEAGISSTSIQLVDWG
jgi:hypothetical protein